MPERFGFEGNKRPLRQNCQSEPNKKDVNQWAVFFQYRLIIKYELEKKMQVNKQKNVC